MWAKFSSALKSTTTRPQVPEETRSTTPVQFGPSRAETPQSIGRSQAEVTAHLLGESSSDSPAFGVPSTSHIPPLPQSQHSSPPPSPSRRSLFKRSKDTDSVRGTSASLKLLPKKIRGSLPFGNASQSSLASSIDSHQSAAPGKPPSTKPVTQHKPRSSQDTLRSFASAVRRPSLDILRSAVQETSSTASSPVESPTDNTRQLQQPRCNSVRSILRDPKTPGTGQNVRFFSRDAFKVISPEESMDETFLTPPQQVRLPEQNSLMDRLNQTDGRTDTPITRLSPPQSKSRPSLNGIFGPMDTLKKDNDFDAQSHTSGSSAAMSLSSTSPFNANGSLDMPNQLNLPAFPPGLNFEVASSLGSAIDLDLSMDGDTGGTRMTSTPCKPGRWNEEGSIKDEDEKEETKVEEMVFDETVSIQHSVQPTEDETIYHSLERAPVVSPLPFERSQSPPERSQSFSFGQTVFHSMGNSANVLSPPNNNNNNNNPPAPVNAPSGLSSPPNSISRRRGRALSDTVFQSMLRASSPVFKPPRHSAPEADIHDDASQNLVLYSPNSTSNEPDPFNAKANTYYTPQTMIPMTPPSGMPRHTRKTSKEESLIYSLQTQLALQQELCSQFEADLHTKDEMVELLGKKVSDMEKLELQRKSVLRQWKKKVQELERSCRLLEEEVDSSRQESMERSIMDEASGEALRMLHRQIATLEKEKAEWEKKEQMMRVENETLQSLIKDRSQEVVDLKEAMWSRDEVLDRGLRETKEQFDMMGNLSLVGVGEEELRRLAEREKKADEEREVYRAREMEWEQERMELMAKIEENHVEKMSVDGQVEALKEQINVREGEFEMMKSELEAQWGHTETASDTIQELREAKERAEEDIAILCREKEGLEKERDDLVARYREVEQKVEYMEVDWNESENRRMELESEVNELLDLKDAMEKECKQAEEKALQERARSEDLNRALHQCDDRIVQLGHERQLATETITHLENDIRRRDNEIAIYKERLHAQQLECQNLRTELEELTQEHTRLIDEQSQTLTQATGSETEARKHIQDLVRQKTESEDQLKSTRERMDSLKNEMDRLRKHVHELQQESADKEVKMTQMTKQHAQDKEDIQGLNIALDAKQQELELYKRKVAIKPGGSASGTPASASSSSKVIKRRTSSSLADGNIPATARPLSRSASVISDSGSAKGSHSEKVSAFGRSNRVNTLSGTSTSSSAAGSLAAKKRAEGTASAKTTAALRSSLSPPPASMKNGGVKSSVNGTRTVTTPASARRIVPGNADKVRSTTMAARRASIMSPTPSISESSEKENNMDDSEITVRRRSMVPISG